MIIFLHVFQEYMTIFLQKKSVEKIYDGALSLSSWDFGFEEEEEEEAWLTKLFQIASKMS